MKNELKFSFALENDFFQHFVGPLERNFSEILKETSTFYHEHSPRHLKYFMQNPTPGR